MRMSESLFCPLAQSVEGINALGAKELDLSRIPGSTPGHPREVLSLLVTQFESANPTHN